MAEVETLIDPPPTSTESSKPTRFDPRHIDRPDRKLLTYYLIAAGCTGPGFVIALWPMLFKYLTLQYSFDESGVSMRWGVLFRTEIYLTYRRIQDIHLTRNLLQRWLGLATVSIQTASGSATPEMKIEGILEAEALRDYLYSQMRGAKHEAEGGSGEEGEDSQQPQDETLSVLTEIRDALRRIAGIDEPPIGEIATAVGGGKDEETSTGPHDGPASLANEVDTGADQTGQERRS